jgi:hypothetical protein
VKDDLVADDVRFGPRLDVGQAARGRVFDAGQAQRPADDQPLQRRVLDHVEVSAGLVEADGAGDVSQLVGGVVVDSDDGGTAGDRERAGEQGDPLVRPMARGQAKPAARRGRTTAGAFLLYATCHTELTAVSLYLIGRRRRRL